ncbi:hypothetical protein Tco_1131888 [Tanacetum coccineum]|uniref:Uncharacterized protein n=1 Tax=Tanacetum coccineum TaxID=301880 RepID=A0ABQ5JAE3_9ASTR
MVVLSNIQAYSDYDFFNGHRMQSGEEKEVFDRLHQSGERNVYLSRLHFFLSYLQVCFYLMEMDCMLSTFGWLVCENWKEANSVYTSYIVSPASNGKIQAGALIFVLVGYISASILWRWIVCFQPLDEQKQFSLMWLASSSASSTSLILIIYFYFYFYFYFFFYEATSQFLNSLTIRIMNWGEANSVYTNYIVSSASNGKIQAGALIFVLVGYILIQKLRQKEVDEESCVKTCSMNWGEANSVYTDYIVSSASNGKIQAGALIFVLVGYIRERITKVTRYSSLYENPYMLEQVIFVAEVERPEDEISTLPRDILLQSRISNKELTP